MQKESTVVQSIKSWIFPSLVSLVSVMIWNDVNEIKADVKLLMAQSNIDKTRIDNLERVVYSGNLTTNRLPEKKPAAQPAFLKIVAVKPEDRISPQADPAKRAL